MFKNLLLTLFVFFISFITIYPSRKENTYLINYCHSLEKILSRNSLEKNKNVSEGFKNFAKDITLMGTNKTQGNLVNRIIDKYKKSKKSLIINSLPNQFYCLIGYWIEEVNPGTFHNIFYEKSKQRIIQYENIKKEVDEYIKDINSEYKSIQNEINNFF